jgi:hypothetical protein
MLSEDGAVVRVSLIYKVSAFSLAFNQASAPRPAAAPTAKQA